MSLIARSYRNYLIRHPWLFLLTVLGVTLGVSVVVAMDLASESARRSFQLSSQTVAGRATHQIKSSTGRFEEELFPQLRAQFPFVPAAPVVSGYLTLTHLEKPVTMTLLGVAPLYERQIREFSSAAAGEDVSQLVGSLDQVVVSEETATQLELELNKPTPARVGQSPLEIRIAGLLKPQDRRSRVGLANILLSDISTAQILLGRVGSLTRIDLILEPTQVESVRAFLPNSVELIAAGAEDETLSQMTDAFHLNLKALSLLSLVVGLFLIYNVTNFSVLHRQATLGRLRTLGMTREELFQTVIREVAWVAALGSCLGLVVGVWLGKGLVVLVSTTLNDLYYVLEITNFEVQPQLILKGFLLGWVGAILAGYHPARRAGLIEPILLVKRSTAESQARKGVRRAAGYGLGCGLLGLVAIQLPGLLAGLFSLLFFLLASALLTPAGVALFAHLFPGKALPWWGRLMVRGLRANLSRLGVAAAALTLAVASAISIGLMVDSFRKTLVNWLETTLQADVYLTLTDRGAIYNGDGLTLEFIEALKSDSKVKEVARQRLLMVSNKEGGQAQAVGVNPVAGYRKSIIFAETVSDHWDAFDQGAVMLSEPHSQRLGKRAGDQITLLTTEGWKSFLIAGVFFSYGPERGLVVMEESHFLTHFEDPGIFGLGIYLHQREQSEDLAAEVRRKAGPGVEVRSTAAIKDLALEIFERTFQVTGVLKILALGVAFIGILSALLALALEKVRETSILRALGLTPTEVSTQLLGQSTLMGLITGLLAMPTGVLLAAVMVKVINKRAFGWTLSFTVDPNLLFQALGLALVAALLSAIYPAYKLSRLAPALGLREE